MFSIRSSFLNVCYQIFHCTQFWFLNINLKFHVVHVSTWLSMFKLIEYWYHTLMNMNSLRTLPSSTLTLKPCGSSNNLKNWNNLLTSQTILYFGNTCFTSNIPFKTHFTKGCFPNITSQWFSSTNKG